MSVKIRLARRGRKKRPVYDIVVANSKSPRDGRFVACIGQYEPVSNPSKVSINVDEAVKWLMNGAQPTDTVRNILSANGVMYKKHLQVGVRKGAHTQEQADAKFAKWVEEKAQKLADAAKKALDAKTSSKKAVLEAEKNANKARIEAILKKKEVSAQKLVEEVSPNTEENA